jgi:SAM-dependent methyltransferase
VQETGSPSLEVTAKASRPGKTGYGLDAPRVVIAMAVVGIASVSSGLIFAYVVKLGQIEPSLSLLAGSVASLPFLLMAALLYSSSRVGKPSATAGIVGVIPWGGDEVVLDIGCGRGLATVLAAKKLQEGYCIGIDTWGRSHLSGNDPKSIRANAVKEGVEERVNVVKGDPRAIPLPDSSVDVILSSLALHYMVPAKQRQALFGEIGRTLKSGGYVGIMDNGHGSEYSALLRRLGMTDIRVRALRLTSFPPFHIITARKPYKG